MRSEEIVQMTSVRKVVDSYLLEDLFDLPSAFKNKQLEVIILPVEEESVSINKKLPILTMEQIEKWAKTPEIQALTGVLAGTSLPDDIKMSDIRNNRLSYKYKV